ncbi:MAG: helix-turn-helix transcriptional regulator [Coprobacillaceae bacterium]
MSKAERLIEMMITINAKRDFTLSELADEFSVSKRTILRDLQTLDRIGFPFYSEVGPAGGYHVLKERILPPIAFSENEAKAIFFAYQSLEFYRDLPFEQETMSALKKFLNYLPNDLQYSITQMQKKVTFWIPDRHCSTPLLKDILNMAINDQMITINYSSQYNESIRTIIPIGLYAMNGLWYCPAYCLKSEAIREFRVDRIIEIINIQNISEEKKEIPNTIHEYLKNLEVGTDYHIEIKLTNIGVKYCETESLLARGLKTSKTGGYIDMHIKESTLDWVAGYLLPLGNNATILGPVELMDIMKSKIQELQEHYCSTKK